MSVPIKKLTTLLRERVFVKWLDPSGSPSTLGSCLYDNKQNPKFVMTAGYDMEGHVHIHFSLMVSIKLAGKVQQMELLLVVPPDANFADASTPLPKSNIDDLSFLDASALHEAGISESEHVILIQFDLTARGFVVMKKKTSPTIRPSNSTSNKLIRSLESLSGMIIFSVYIRPNDYAREGLKEVCKLLNNTGSTIQQPTSMKEMYVQQGAMLVEWGRFVYQDRQDALLPPYTENPNQLLSEVQVPQSPPIICEKDGPSINTVEVTIAETPTRTPFSPSPEPILHGILSSSEQSSDCEVNLDDFEENSRYIETDFDVGSDEEFLANLNSRELSQQLNNDLGVPQILQSKFMEWINEAIMINPDVYQHKHLITKLLILGDCVRTSNARVFDATRYWCSAILFYDPFDSDNTPELWEEGNRWLISDIAKLIKWANEFHYGAEISSLLMKDFVKLGSSARTIALQSGHDKDEYNLQKSVCIVRVLVEFGKPGVGAGRKNNSKSVIRKEKAHALESRNNSNVSKRARISSEI